MIIIFGPPGAGKSIQGQMLAARMGWRWLSAGQLLRDQKDPELLSIMQTGELVPHERTNQIMDEAIARAEGIQVIIDGFPRAVAQAEWLVNTHGHAVHIAILLDVPKEEVVKRLSIRGRSDDDPEAIEQRFEIYEQEMRPIIDYLKDHNISVETVDGVGSVGEIHDRIVSTLTEYGLTS